MLPKSTFKVGKAPFLEEEVGVGDFEAAPAVFDPAADPALVVADTEFPLPVFVAAAVVATLAVAPVALPRDLVR
jgi:hypothetical protein